MSAIKRIVTAYDMQCRVKNPIKTKMATCFCLFSLGDITCQRLQKLDKWDKGRTLRQGLAATFINNPMSQLFIAKIAPMIVVSHFFKNANFGIHMQNFTRAVFHTFIMGIPQAGGVPFGSAVI